MKDEQEESSSSKTSQFSPYHHEKTQFAYRRAMGIWEDKINEGKRCRACWLRPQDCCCSPYFQQRREIYTKKEFYNDGNPQSSYDEVGVQFLIYYHFREIGRSANTAHLMENIIPCQKIIYGDSEKEIFLANEIYQEYLSGKRRTVILYPSATSIGINQWMNENFLKDYDYANNQINRENSKHQHISNGSSSSSSSSSASWSLRLILLDGTYSDADKLARHLEQLLLHMYNCPTPLVKLDLENGKCTSAVVGIMYQPNPEKICTFQAAIMAAQQVISNIKRCYTNKRNNSSHHNEFCDMLYEDLNYWINHLLVSKIKFGKVQAKFGNKNVDNTPSKIVREFLQSSPPPVGSGLKIKKGNVNGLYVTQGYDHILDADGNITLLGKNTDKYGVVYRTAEEKRKWQQENFKKHTCKFWRVDGNCKYGDECKFRHDFDNEIVKTVGPTGLIFIQITQKFHVLSLMEALK